VVVAGDPPLTLSSNPKPVMIGTGGDGAVRPPPLLLFDQRSWWRGIAWLGPETDPLIPDVRLVIGHLSPPCREPPFEVRQSPGNCCGSTCAAGPENR
jgi:hypothetical protein